MGKSSGQNVPVLHWWIWGPPSTSWLTNCWITLISTLYPAYHPHIQGTREPDSRNVPEEYSDLLEVFSKARASQLPPHRSWDCAFELLPNTTPDRSKVYPLSRPESQAMESYIEWSYTTGFIRPATSLAAAGFFFVKKKDGSLRLCIDYRGLN